MNVWSSTYGTHELLSAYHLLLLYNVCRNVTPKCMGMQTVKPCIYSRTPLIQMSEYGHFDLYTRQLLHHVEQLLCMRVHFRTGDRAGASGHKWSAVMLEKKLEGIAMPIDGKELRSASSIFKVYSCCYMETVKS